MLALRWGNLDLEGDHGSLRVRRTLDKYSAAVFGAAKTRPQASLFAFSDAKESLIAQRDVLRREKLAVGD